MGKKIWIIILAIALIGILSFVIYIASGVIFNAKVVHDNELMNDLGAAFKAAYDEYQNNTSLSDDWRKNFDEYRQGVTIEAWDTIVEKSKDQDSVEHFLAEQFNENVRQGYNANNTIFEDLGDSFRYTDGKARLFVKITDNAVVLKLLNPSEKLKSNNHFHEANITPLKELPFFLFAITYDEKNRPGKTVVINMWGEIYESNSVGQDINDVDQLMPDPSQMNFYTQYEFTDSIDTITIYDLYQEYTSSVSSEEENVSENHTELINKLESYIDIGDRKVYGIRYETEITDDGQLTRKTNETFDLLSDVSEK